MRRTKFPNKKADEIRIFKSVQGLIYSQALAASRNGGVPFDEMLAQANLLFVQSLRKFDDKVGVKFSTFLFTCLHNGLIDYGKRLRKHHKGSPPLFLVPDENGDLISAHGPDMRVNGFVDTNGDWNNYVDSYVDARALGQFSVFEVFEDMSVDARAIAELVTAGFCDSLEKLRALAINRLGFAQDQFDEAVADLNDLVNNWR